MLTDICSPLPGVSGHWEQHARCRPNVRSSLTCRQGESNHRPSDNKALALSLSHTCHTFTFSFLHNRSLSGISVAYVKQSYNDNQLIVSVSFQAKVSNISWFQLLKCEDLFLFSDSKSRVWGFWTKDISLCCGDTKNCHGKNASFLHNLSRLYGLNY